MSFLDSLSNYPRWFVIACAIVAAVAAVWIVARLLKLALWLLLVAVIVAGAAVVAWSLLR